MCVMDTDTAIHVYYVCVVRACEHGWRTAAAGAPTTFSEHILAFSRTRTCKMQMAGTDGGENVRKVRS